MTDDTRLLSGLCEELHTIADTLEAAHTTALHRRAREARTLRDELGDLDATGEAVSIQCSDGTRWTGTLASVGLDHVQLHTDAGARRLIALFHIVSVVPAS